MSAIHKGRLRTIDLLPSAVQMLVHVDGLLPDAWGPIWSGIFANRDAEQICRMAGFSGGSQSVRCSPPCDVCSSFRYASLDWFPAVLLVSSVIPPPHHVTATARSACCWWSRSNLVEAMRLLVIKHADPAECCTFNTDVRLHDSEAGINCK